ncbi:MAG TPA: hypothetical protein VGK46_05400, partial [Saprospiraceae bacterium]
MKLSSLILFPNALSMSSQKNRFSGFPVEEPTIYARCKAWILFLLALPLFCFTNEVYGQCDPNTISWGYGGPQGSPFDYACGNESYHGISSVTHPTGTGQTYQWQYSFNGGAYVTTVLNTENISKAQVTSAILGTNSSAAGYYLIRRVINDASPSACSSTSPTVVLYWADPPAKPVSGGLISPANTSSCVTANGTLTLSNHTGPVLRWEVTSNSGSTWTVIPNTTNSYNYTLPTAGTYCYRALVDDICSGTVGVIDVNDDYSAQGCVTVNQLPTITTPGGIAAVCFNAGLQNSTLAYSATTNNPSSYSINWDATANANGLQDQGNTSFGFMAGGGTINNIVVSGGALPGNYSGTMTIMNAINCTNTQAVTITIHPLPTITTTGTIDALCFNTMAQVASLTYTATSNNPTSYSIDWNNAANSAGLVDQGNTVFAFMVGGGVISTIAIPADIPAATYSGNLTILNANGCSNSVPVTLAINTPATVNAGPDQTVCVDFPTVTLVGMIGGSASTSLWTTSGTGMFVNAMSPNTVYNPSAADNMAGTVTLTLTTNDPLGPCMAVSDFLIVTIEDNCCVPECPEDIVVECGDSTDPSET